MSVRLLPDRWKNPLLPDLVQGRKASTPVSKEPSDAYVVMHLDCLEQYTIEIIIMEGAALHQVGPPQTCFYRSPHFFCNPLSRFLILPISSNFDGCL